MIDLWQSDVANPRSLVFMRAGTTLYSTGAILVLV
jgi:hypothetical protein